MGGKNKKVTVGYWYKLLYHAGLCKGPFDAFLEFRGGSKPAWKGELKQSGTISIDAPNLWGGEKDQGGIVGDVDVMFGEADQQPNAYMLANLGNQIPAWRGLGTLVFKGGKYGAMNPYPQKASYKIRKITKGWDNDTCWYPEKAEIPFNTFSVPYDDMWSYRVEPPGSSADYSSPNYDHSGWEIGKGAFGSWTPPESGIALNTFVSGQIGKAIWLRRQVNFVGLTTIDVYHDDGAWLWVDGEPVALTEVTYFHARAQVLLTGDSVIALKVVDGVPGGSSNIFAGLAFTGGTQDKLGMNPAHVLYFTRTNSDMGREPTANINDASLRAAADKLHDEGFGICAVRDPARESVEEFERRICRLIGGSFTRDVIDGQWHLDLARGDYVLEELPVLTDDDILEFREVPSTLDNAINSVSVKYFDPEKKEEIVTPPAQAHALIMSFGTIHQTNHYPEIPTADLASRVAMRDLLATATPTRVFELVTTRKSYAWRPNQYFRLQAAKRGIQDMVCIVGEKQSGTLKSGAIRLKATQDIYSLPTASFIEVEEGVDTRPPQTPLSIVLQRAFEAPYIEVVQSLTRADLAALPEDVGYLLAVAADPAISRDYTLAVAADAITYAPVTNGDWCPTAAIVEAAGHVETAFTLSGGERLDQVAVGSAALWDEEIVRVDAIDAGAGTISLGRGCADTVPQRHAAGSQLWFYDASATADASEYTAGETIGVKLLTNTGSQQLDESLAAAMSVDFNQRLARPYPPANVKLNGESYPASLTLVGDLEVTAVHRDRVLQADQLVDQTIADIGPEPGTTYVVRNVNALTEAETYLATDITAWPHTVPAANLAASNRLEIYSVRDGLESLQRVQVEFTTGQLLLAESGDPILTENDDTILME